MKRLDEGAKPGLVISGIASLLLWAGHRVMQTVDDQILTLAGEDDD